MLRDAVRIPSHKHATASKPAGLRSYMNEKNTARDTSKVFTRRDRRTQEKIRSSAVEDAAAGSSRDSGKRSEVRWKAARAGKRTGRTRSGVRATRVPQGRRGRRTHLHAELVTLEELPAGVPGALALEELLGEPAVEALVVLALQLGASFAHAVHRGGRAAPSPTAPGPAAPPLLTRFRRGEVTSRGAAVILRDAVALPRPVAPRRARCGPGAAAAAGAGPRCPGRVPRAGPPAPGVAAGRAAVAPAGRGGPAGAAPGRRTGRDECGPGARLPAVPPCRPAAAPGGGTGTSARSGLPCARCEGRRRKKRSLIKVHFPGKYKKSASPSRCKLGGLPCSEFSAKGKERCIKLAHFCPFLSVFVSLYSKK